MTIQDQAIAAMVSSAYWSGDHITFSIAGPGSVWPAYGPDTEPTDPYYSTFNATQAQYFRFAISQWTAVRIQWVERYA